MAGTLKVDSINADSNLSFRIANTAVAFIDSNGLRPTSGNVSLDSTGTTGVRSPAANTLVGYTSGVEAFRVTSAGDVGIGTSSPATKLDVSGNIKLNNQLYSDGDLILDAVFSTMIKKSGSTNATINQFGIGLAGSNLSSGTGIAFPATQNPSSDANTLDDYEEGTWTPSVGGNATYIARYGIYTKIGNIVTCQFRINIDTIGTGSSTTLSGLPFTSANIGSASDVQTGCVSFWSALAVNTTFLSFYVENNATTTQFVGKASSGPSVDNGIGLFGSNSILYGSVTYRVAS
jgi:hypothetical protein